jgi:hypothetical protein
MSANPLPYELMDGWSWGGVLSFVLLSFLLLSTGLLSTRLLSKFVRFCSDEDEFRTTCI